MITQEEKIEQDFRASIEHASYKGFRKGLIASGIEDKDEIEGLVEEQRWIKRITRALLKYKFTVPEIADALDLPKLSIQHIKSADQWTQKCIDKRLGRL